MEKAAVHADGVQLLELAATIRAARIQAQLSQRQVAVHLGIPRSAVSAIENGRRRVDVVELKRLALLMRVSAATLIGESDGRGIGTAEPVQGLAGPTRDRRQHHLDL